LFQSFAETAGAAADFEHPPSVSRNDLQDFRPRKVEIRGDSSAAA
jgi:hypothetical protein